MKMSARTGPTTFRLALFLDNKSVIDCAGAFAPVFFLVTKKPGGDVGPAGGISLSSRKAETLSGSPDLVAKNLGTRPPHPGG